MKYIDAEKLIAALEREIKSSSKGIKPGKSDEKSTFCRGEISALYTIKSLIDSLHQEQPEPSNNLVDVDAVREDFITEVYRVLDADPTNDRANAIINAFDSLPTVSQEQPEVEFALTLDDIKLIIKIYNEVLFKSFKVCDIPSEVLRRFNEQRKK